MSQLSGLVEVDPVALAKGVHVHQVFTLNLVRVPQCLQDVIPSRALELFRRQVGDPVLVFYLREYIPTGSMIFLMSK